MNKLEQELFNYLMSNKILLHYPQLHTEESRVNLHYFMRGFEKGRSETNRHNLGDYLSLVVVEHMLKLENLDLSHEVAMQKHLYAIGSILLMGYQNATIWGTGLPFSPSLWRGVPHHKFFRNLDIRCVRGPLTRQVLLGLGHDCPEIYGDPAILMPLFYTPHIQKSHEFIIIPHFSQEAPLKKNV